MRWILLCAVIFLSSCGSNGQGRHGACRIGIDPTWVPLDFKEQQSYVNGYVEDLLLEVSRYSGIRFEKITANWDSLFDELNNERYDAVLSSLPRYTFNLAKYNFSQNILDTGPVLIVPWKSRVSRVDQLSGEMVGILTGDPAVLILEKYPKITIRTFTSIPELLNEIVSGQIAAALLDTLLATSYTNNLYAGYLKIASEPLTEAGLHAITVKKDHDRFIRAFNNAIEQLKKKKTIQALQKKWQLSS